MIDEFSLVGHSGGGISLRWRVAILCVRRIAEGERKEANQTRQQVMSSKQEISYRVGHLGEMRLLAARLADLRHKPPNTVRQSKTYVTSVMPFLCS